jgi:hypothetical protein
MIIDTFGNIVDSKIDKGFCFEELYEGEYVFNGDNIFYELDANCVEIYDTFQNILFPDSDAYYKEQSVMPIWSYSGGHDSDSGIDKYFFEKMLNAQKSEQFHKHIYLADCQAMISALQDRFLFIKGVFVDFYKSLSSIQGRTINEDTIIWVSGQSTATVFSNLYNVFITSYSTLDLITKIAFELENIRNDFSNYPKLASSNVLFGAKTKIQNINTKDTVFENCELINTIVNIRNELIHNGSWETNPKVFMEFQGNKVVKKWILFPDTENGNICTFKNRKRFFGKGEEINERLPNIVLEILNRMNETVKKINQNNA